MENLPKITWRRIAWGKAAWMFLVLTGCTTTSGPLALKSDGPSGPAPCQIAATWKNEVVFTADSANGGRQIPGLAGRVYLFGEKMDFPFVGDGSVVVDLFDASKAGTPAAARPLEEWRLDKDTLHRLERKDTIGMGYTLFLPWSTYRPEITTIVMKVRYDQPKGMPLYTEGPVTLNNGSGFSAGLPIQTKVVTEPSTAKSNSAPNGPDAGANSAAAGGFPNRNLVINPNPPNTLGSFRPAQQ